MTRCIAIDRLSYDTWHMRLLLTLLFFVGLAFLPSTASAFDIEETLREQHIQYQGSPELRISQGGCMSLAQATESVRRRTGGRVLSAETRVQGGREVHYIKVIKDGKVKTHKVNGCKR